VTAIMTMMIPFHAAVIVFQGMFVRKKAGMSMPWSVIMTIGMMPLILMHPAWYRLRSMLAVIMTISIVVDELDGYFTFVDVIVTRRSSPRQHESSGGGRSQ